MTLSNPFVHDPRVYNEAITFTKAGHEVTVIAWDRKKENKEIDEKDGIKIIRVYNTFFMKILPYDIFRLPFWCKQGYKKALKFNQKKPIDIVHCHNLDTLPIGIKLKKKLGIPIVYDAHEIWGYMVSKDLPKPWADYYLWKEKNLLPKVDRIITVNEPLKEYFSKISNKKIILIMNSKPLQEKTYQQTKNEKFTILYIGTLTKTRFIPELIDVIKDIQDVHCVIGGIGKKDFVEKIKNKIKNIENVEFIGKVPFEQVIPMTKKSDLIINMIDPGDLNMRNALTNKQFESMVCGRPIIVTRGTYPSEFTQKEKCGIIIDYNKKELKKAIIELKENKQKREELGKNALKAAIREYNWEKQEEKLIKLYKEIK